MNPEGGSWRDGGKDLEGERGLIEGRDGAGRKLSAERRVGAVRREGAV